VKPAARRSSRTLQTTLVWWINDQIDGAEDFLEWSGRLERADSLRAELLKAGGTMWPESCSSQRRRENLGMTLP